MEENKTVVQVDSEAQALYMKNIHRVGTITMMLVLLITILPVLYIYILHGGFPGWGTVSAAFGAAFVYGASTWLMEVVLYFPMVGVPGCYMCFTAGNIFTMRVPCSVAAQNAVDAKAGTPKGDMASVIGMAASVVVNFICLGVVILFGNFIVSILPETVKVAFNYVMPALFGSLILMMVQMFFKKS